jgi:hypothetical protein
MRPLVADEQAISGEPTSGPCVAPTVVAYGEVAGKLRRKSQKKENKQK